MFSKEKFKGIASPDYYLICPKTNNENVFIINGDLRN